MGRPKGSGNKVKLTPKAAVMFTFERLGGSDWLFDFAKQYPVEFVKLYGKLLPREVVGEVEQQRRFHVQQTIIDASTGEPMGEQLNIFAEKIIEGETCSAYQ